MDMSLKNIFRWSGIACVLSGVLFTLAYMVHPSQETPLTILSMETRLVAGHWFFTLSFAFLLLGLPGLFVAQAEKAGWLGLISFLMVFFGTVFFAVSNDFGFIAPVLAAHAPDMLDAINAYPPVIVTNALLAIGFILGFILFGVGMLRAGVFPMQAGLLVAIGTPVNLIGGALALTITPALWVVAVLGALLLGSGLAWAGFWLWNGRVVITYPQKGSSAFSEHAG